MIHKNVSVCSVLMMSVFSLMMTYFSWGPDDDGKTVDGPHRLAAVSYHVAKHFNPLLVINLHGVNCLK